MTSPILVNRLTKVIETKGSKELVSTSFVARFVGGSEKVLNLTKWQPVGLRKEADGDYRHLSISECPLYFRDWSKNPIMGKWDIDYPNMPTIPYEILSLL